MTMIDDGRLPDEYSELHDMAVQLLQEPALAAAVSLLLKDRDVARKLAENPSLISELLGLEIPKGLDVHLVGLGKPFGDWVPFSVRLTGCRHYYIRQKDKFEKVGDLSWHRDRAQPGARRSLGLSNGGFGRTRSGYTTV